MEEPTMSFRIKTTTMTMQEQAGSAALDGRGARRRCLVTALFLGAMGAAILAPVRAHAARLATPRTKAMNLNFSPDELDLGATAIAVSERSEPLRLQFADSGSRGTPIVAAAEGAVSPRRGPIATSLDAVITVSAIQTWRFDQRDKSADDLVTCVDATHRSLETLAGQRSTLRSDEARTAFNTALRAAEDAEQQLRRSLQAARSASEQDWSLARSAVSADFAVYAEAVSQAETAMAAGSTEDSGKRLG